MPVGDDHSVKAAKALALPTRSAMLNHLLSSSPLTAKEIADEFSLHANVARAHLDLLVEAGFLATGIRRKGKGRPAKVYFTWEGEMGGVEMVEPVTTLPSTTRGNPYRLISALLIRLVGRIDSEIIYPVAESVARDEGAKMMHGYRAGGLDFQAAVRALVEELQRYSPGVRMVRVDDESAELETPDCAFRDIALEHSALVLLLDPALKEGAMESLGHPSEVEVEASVARGDDVCREVIRRRKLRVVKSRGPRGNS
ncbi:MAG: helix-turn-helix domain-containing protein [Actinomycetota bacterium]